MTGRLEASRTSASGDTDFDAGIRAHDAAVSGAGTEIWLGAEPTFTLSCSESAEWLSEALGGDKELFALRLAAALQERRPRSLLLRTVGRQYAGEDRPRWSVGLFERRDGQPLWDGPPDPLSGPAEAPQDAELERLWEALERALSRRAWSCVRFTVPGALGRRLLMRLDGGEVGPVCADDPRLARVSVNELKIPSEGLADTLAQEGLLLLSVGAREVAPEVTAAHIELPAFDRVVDFIECVAAVGEAARASGLRGLVLQGFPPPVDASVAWTTITPDPAVIEVNQAPQPDVERFLAAQRELFAVTQPLGLLPYRLHYNGTVSDSGGGGQFTLGGPSASASPFFVEPTLLPKLVRYFNQHPSLSYLFAPTYVGGASQSPRPDEGTREAFLELAVALEQLERQPHPSPEFLWSSLAPFLADPSGNAHRCELNIEKLWNPYLPSRGRLGLVEFRAFRMPCSPERAAAIATLLRAIVAMLPDSHMVPRLRDWGDILHDRFALPFFLRQDLRSVFDDLAARGFGLGESLRDVLLQDRMQARWSIDFAGCELALERAIEFWPLVGDVASQEAGGSRLVDSSTLRLQLSLRSVGTDAPSLEDWRLQIGSYEVPLRSAASAPDGIRLIGLRYRDFTPWRGLHPAIKPYGPLTLTLDHPAVAEALQTTLHGWRPDGMAYAGLPSDPEVAAARRAERLVIRRLAKAQVPAAKAPPPQAVSEFTFDLRRL